MSTSAMIAELRRQREMRNATWPCVLLKDLMPMCDEVEQLREQVRFILDRDVTYVDGDAVIRFADNGQAMAAISRLREMSQ